MRALLLLLAACGRLGFDSATTTDGGPPADAAPVHTGRWAHVAQGKGSTCAITDAGALWCFGYGGSGQLGIGTTPLASGPIQVAGTWSEVAVAVDHACGVQIDGTLWCWGLDDRGQLGDGARGPAESSPKRVGAGTWMHVTVGYQFSCALDVAGNLWCWGTNTSGQLGIGSVVEQDAPAQVVGTWSAIAAGDGHACALSSSDHTMSCWGQNGSRQLGDGTTAAHASPAAVLDGRVYKQVATGSTFTCGIDEADQAFCWGDGEVGQLGIGATQFNGAATPQPQGGPTLSSIALASTHGCGVATTGGLFCWGAGQRGQLAGTEATRIGSPTAIATPTTPAFVTASGATTCYVDVDGKLWCTGANAGGQAGQPFGERHDVEVADALTDWKAVFAHRLHACGSREDGTSSCWGLGLDHQLGDGAQLSRQTPSQLSTGGFSSIDMGETTTVGISGGDSYVWGQRLDGVTQEAVPVLFNHDVDSISVSDSHGCEVFSTTHNLHCQGANDAGQLGDGSTTPSTDVQLAGKWSMVRASTKFTCATTLNGALYCWGANTFGQLGVDDTDARLVPTASLVADPILALSIGLDFGCAITTDNALHCWGANDRGQLGIGTSTPVGAPVHLAGSWKAIALGDEHACGIRTDSTLWCWGHASNGQLGTSSGIDRTSPAQLGADTGWTSVTAGDRFTCAVRDQRRYCFGANDSGELGNAAAWLTDFMEVK